MDRLERQAGLEARAAQMKSASGQCDGRDQGSCEEEAALIEHL
jgi:hypothetical protein